MVDLRDGFVGYYSNPGARNFVWLDRGRTQGLMFSGPARVPPGPYRLVNNTPTLTQVYVKLWHATVVLSAITAWAWWRGIRPVRPGRCFACGYDLSGLAAGADVGVSCPECGAVDDVGGGQEGTRQ